MGPVKLTRGSAIALTLAAAAAATALFVTTAQGATASSTLNLVIKSSGHEYLTAAGSSSVFPGRLRAGDRILGRDTLLDGTRPVGYDNELCTVRASSVPPRCRTEHSRSLRRRHE
jgi:hypothetical protein